MTIFDFILLFVWAGFLFYGLFFGFIRTLGSLLGVIIGAWLAGLLYLDIFNLVEPWFFGLDNLGKIIVFLVLFLIIVKLVSLAVSVADRAFDIISIIPFLKTINRLLGGILGFFEGVVVLGLALYGLALVSSFSGTVGGWLVNSQVAYWLIKIIGLIVPFLEAVI